MSEETYTYDKPNEKHYLDTLIGWLGHKQEHDLARLLDGSTCSIRTTTSFSGRRWNAYHTTVLFYVPVERMAAFDDEKKRRLTKLCQQIMPPEAGFDVTEVEIAPAIMPRSKQTLSDDLDMSVQSQSMEILEDILPGDVKTKGKEMAEAYLYLYSVENCIRLFVEKVAKENLGVDYFSKLEMSKDIRNRVISRKQEEAKKKWLRVRGDSNIFYLDFKDLGSIMTSNWNIFGQYFQDQTWILNKINELADCRNLVAHNSYIGDHEKDVIRVNFNGILRQIGAKANS
jgi:hypothetical protein